MKKRLCLKNFMSVLFLLVNTFIFALNINISTFNGNTNYDNGDEIQYLIRVENPAGEGTKNNLNISAPLSQLVSTLDSGGNGNVFSNLENIINLENRWSGADSDPDYNEGSFSPTGDFLTTGVSLPEGAFVEYIVSGVVNNGVNGNIQVTAQLDDSGNILTDDIEIGRVPYTYNISKSTTQNYYEKNGEVEYKVLVSNTGAYEIKELLIEDQVTNYLEGISISAVPGINSFEGTFSTSGDLEAVGVRIAPGEAIEYTINGQVKSGINTAIENIATSTVRNESKVSNQVDLNLAIYEYVITKDVIQNEYVPGGGLTYKIKIENTSSTVGITKMEIEDELTGILALSAEGINKVAFDPNTISITATTSDSNSSSGNYNPNSNLFATDVKISPNNFVEYEISLEVNSDIVGTISNTSKATDRNGIEKISANIEINSAKPQLNISKSSLSLTYKPEDQIVYTLNLTNTGDGIAKDYKLKDLLASLNVNLANNGGPGANDLLGNPFSDGNIHVTLASGSSNSTSDLLLNGGTTSQLNLEDTVTVFPGEELIYTITLNTKSTAISNLSNVAVLENEIGNSAGTSNTVEITAEELGNNDEVKIEKTTLDTEYTPGGTVEYEILVKNPTDLFMNNVTISDLLNQVQAMQLDMSQGQAFSSWKIDVVSSSGEGTVSGDFSFGSFVTENFVNVVDIGPMGEIKFKIIATVADTTVGTIIDDKTISGDNVEESGSGIKMSNPQLEVSKHVDTTEYIPGAVLTYEVEVTNPGDGIAAQVKVVDKLSEITTELIDGTVGPAYSSWTISAKVYDISGSNPVEITDPNEITNPDIQTPYTQDLNLSNVVLGPNKMIVYKIEAMISDKARGKIVNKVSVNGDIVSDKGAITRIEDISISKSGPTSYVSDGSTDEITYTIKISNDPVAGVALKIPVSDTLDNIKANLLSDIGQGLVFESWEISVPNLVGPETTTQITSPITSPNNLEDVVNISPGGSVEYTITGKLNKNLNGDILYGSFSNTARAGDKIDTHTVYPKLPRLDSIKKGMTPSYTPGGTVEFQLTVTNNGTGYANNAQVKDFMDTNYFSSWEITATTVGIGTTSGIVGTETGNLDTTIDISPGGSVTYTIEAVIKNDVSGPITNKATINDIQNDIEQEVSATIDKITGAAVQTLDIRKYSNSIRFSPGQPLEYFIEIKNNSRRIASDILVVDELSSVLGTYANELVANNTTDLQNQPVFDNWTIYKGTTSNPSTVLESLGTNNLNDTINIPVNGTIYYKIVANVNERVVSEKIKNKVQVFNTDENTLIGTSSIEHNKNNPGGGITRTVNKVNYIPGVDELIYTIKVNSTGPGYQNNVSINELIKNLEVELIDGTTGNPFVNPETGNYEFTVAKVNTVTTLGTEEEFSVGPADNENLIGIVDVKPGEELIYQIKGIVRKDAIGVINNKGLETSPFRYNLVSRKMLDGPKYSPGKNITYSIEIQNNSKGNAMDILIEDDFGKIMTTGVNGNQVPAFTNFVVESTSIAEGFKANLGTPTIDAQGKLTAIADIPIGGKLIYYITVTINDEAVGDITNTAIVGGDSVSNQIKSSLGKLKVKKEVVGLYDDTGSTIPISDGYFPGGEIEFLITVENIGEGTINDFSFIDELSKQNTEYANNSGNNKAFDSWTITLENSTGIVTNPDVDGTINNNSDINTKVDISPGGGFVYRVRAKINEAATGGIKNTVNIGNSSSTTDIVPTAEPRITHTKKAFEGDGTTPKDRFYPGDEVVYIMRIENVGDGISNSQSYSDIIANIQGEVIESTGTVENPKELVFETYNVSYTTSGGNVTTVGTFNEVINLPNQVTIAPDGFIEFKISGTLKKTLIGNFVNRSTYAGDNKSVTIRKLNTTILVEKELIELGGVPFTGQDYKPGDEIKYQLTIENTGKSIFDDLQVRDDIESIVAELSGGSTGVALENISISHVITNLNNNPVLSYVQEKAGNSSSNIINDIDLAPGDKVVYTITANIKANVVGVIPGNVANVNGKNYKTPDISQISPLISSQKELLTPVDRIYGPNEEVTYKITINNSGEGYGNNIPIIDLISDIKTEIVGGVQGQAFSSWEFPSVEVIDSDSKFKGFTNLNSQLQGNNNINTSLDIAPGSVMEITIRAITSNLAVGDIKNISIINNENNESEEITARKAKINVLKRARNEQYSPDGVIGFDIEITNTTNNAIANNVQIVDLISQITVDTIDGNQEAAFKSGWTVTGISGGSSDVYVGGVPSTGDIDVSNIDIGPGKTAIITIEGRANSKGKGVIQNTVSYSYEQQSGSSADDITPFEGEIAIEKRVSTQLYTPGENVIYALDISNIGKGYAEQVNILEDILGLTTEIAGIGNPTGQAFESFSILSSAGNNLNTSSIQDTSYTDGYKGVAVIYPGDTLRIQIEAKVSENALGEIKNELVTEFNNIDKKDSASMSSITSNLVIEKEVDKTTYISQDTLTYKIKIKNTGKGWANNVVVEDKISEITTDFLTGTTPSEAFESWTINYINNGLVQPSQTSDNTDVNVTMDIEPETTYEIEVMAKIKSGATGEILNFATLINMDNITNSNNVTSNAKIAELTISKIADVSNYNQGENVTYTIVVANTTNTSAGNVIIKDPISSIKTLSSKGDTSGSLVNAYEEWIVESVTRSSGKSITSISPNIGDISTEDILIETNLDPLESIVLVLKAKVTDGKNNPAEGIPVGDIKNESILEYNGEINTATSVVGAPIIGANDLIASKKITKLNNEEFTGQKYEPGDSIQYKISIENTRINLVDNINIQDIISNVTTQLSGASIGTAIESDWTITINKGESTTFTYPETISNGEEISLIADIDAGDTLEILIDGKILETAVGEITNNIVTINGDIFKSEVLSPENGILEFEKNIIEGEVYNQGEVIKYEIILRNVGKGFLNDIELTDNISGILSENVSGLQEGAFESWTINMSKQNENTSFQNTYPLISQNLSEVLDIAPGDTVIFTVEGKVKEDTIGEIKNTAIVRYTDFNNEPKEEQKEVISISGVGEVEIEKTPFLTTYTPGGEIGFDVIVRNKSTTNIASKIKLADIISTIVSEKIGGGTTESFKSGWTISSTITGDEKNSNITNIPSTQDIDGVLITLGKNTSVTIQIRGTAADNIYGEIINTASYTYFNEEGKSESKIETVDGDIRVIKNIDKPTYISGEELTYTVQVSNVGTGIISGLILEDQLSSIQTEISGEGTVQGPAFTSWNISSIQVPNSSSILNTDDTNGYKVVMDIAPQDTVIIEVKATTQENAFGEIINKVTATYNTSQGKQEMSDTATTVGKQGNIFIEKKSDITEYIPNGYVNYTLVLTNSGEGWTRNIIVEDILSSIETEILGGELGKAFDPNDIIITFVTGEPLNSVIISEEFKPDLKAEVDIKNGTTIEIKIKAKINLNSVGDIVNLALIKDSDGEIESNEVLITQNIPNVSISKTVDKPEYDVNDSLVYKIIVKNEEATNINGIVVKDLISDILALDSTGNMVYPFENVDIAREELGEVIISQKEPEPGIIDEISLGGNSSITYTITAQIKNNIVGEISNTVEKTGRVGREEVKVTSFPKTPTLSVEKIVSTSVNNDTSISQNETVTYTIKIKTDVPSFNVYVTDEIRLIKNKNGENLFAQPSIKIVSLKENGVDIPYTGNIDSGEDTIIIQEIVSEAELIVEATVDGNIKLEADEVIENKVIVYSDQKNDGIPDENQKEAAVNIAVDQPTLNIYKSIILPSGETELFQGQTINYVVEIENPTTLVAVTSENLGVVLSLTDEVRSIINSDGEIVFENIKIVSIKDQNNVEIPKVATLNDNKIFGYTGDISDTEGVINFTRVEGNSKYTILIEADVREDIGFVSQEPITNTAQLYSGESAEVTVSAGKQELSILKEVVEDDILLGDIVEFKIEVENIGKSFANDVIVMDMISQIEGKSFSGGSVPAFTEWEITAISGPNSSFGTFISNNADLNVTDATIAVGEKITYTIKAKLSVDLIADSITNTAEITDSRGRDEKESSAEVNIRRPQISIDKEVGVRETSIGKFVPYRIYVRNNEDKEVKNIFINDNPPSGFKYVEDSLGVVKNEKRIDTIDTEASGNLILVGPFDLKGKEEIEIEYLMQVSIGAVQGTYKNTAFVTNSSGQKVSNDTEAEVDVVEDPLFETTTIIGKVYHDRDGDGVQDDGRATKIKVQQYIPENDYIPNSTVLLIDDNYTYVKDLSVPLTKGLEIKDIIYGRITETDPIDQNKIVIYTGLKSIDKLGDIKVTTGEGTELILTKNNEVKKRYTGLMYKGMSSQNIILRREILKRKTYKDSKDKAQYIQKITIINAGIQEEGIPGVRIASVEGLVIITDQYGRFHIPEVSSKKGENYILKVDPASLPTGSIFMTENPKVQRLGVAMLKYNFGVVLPSLKYIDIGDRKKALKVSIHPNMIFIEGRAKLKPVIYENVFSEIKKNISSGDVLYIEMNRTKDNNLDKLRMKALKEELSKYFNESSIEIQIKGREEGGV